MYIRELSVLIRQAYNASNYIGTSFNGIVHSLVQGEQMT